MKNNNSEKKFVTELDGKTWTKYSISIWDDLKKTKEERELKHPAMFPVELPKRFIRIYTKKGDVVLDPFLGTGSTVIAALELGRKGIGFEISKEYVEIARERVKARLKRKPSGQLTLFGSDEEITIYEPEIYHDDARNMLKYLQPNSVDLCVTSPPYWDVHRQKRTCDRREPMPYTDDKADLGNISDYNEFLNSLKEIFEKVYTVLKPEKHCVVVVMDIRKKDKFYPFHMDLTNVMKEIGFSLEDIIIWDRRMDYNYLRPIGYPYVFRVNKVHEYIMIFKKMGDKND